MRIALVMLFLLCGVGAFAESYPPTPTPAKTTAQPKTNTGQNKSNPGHDEQATKGYPPIIEITKTPIIQVETTDKTEKHHDYSSSEWWLVYLSFALVLVTLGLAIYTAKLYRATVGLGKDAKSTSDRQATEMAESIAEATRAAAAMERVASHMEVSAKASTESVAALKERTAQQMRAYLSVSINSGTFQDRNKNILFGVNPTLLNSGNTPAHKITYWARAEILPFPLPEDFQFPPFEDKLQSSFVLGPHQNIVMNAAVDVFIPDEEVEAIKRGLERRTCIWGIVSYSDVFGDSHTTKFCHSIYFYPEGGIEKVAGIYASRHNEAD